MAARAVAALCVAVVILAAGSARADEPWLPLLKQDGVSVEERGGPGRILPELRAQTVIDGGIFEVVAVIIDVPNQTTWMYECVDARLLNGDPNNVSVIYNRTASPWPVSDRDVVLRTEVTLVEPGTHVAVRFANTTDPAAPPLDGVVRMPQLVGEYDLLSVSDTRTAVTYRVDIDPGGSIPVWLAARAARDLPLQTLLGLRARVASLRGHYEESVKGWKARH